MQYARPSTISFCEHSAGVNNEQVSQQANDNYTAKSDYMTTVCKNNNYRLCIEKSDCCHFSL